MERSVYIIGKEQVHQSETLHGRNHPDCISTKKHVFRLSFLTFSFAPEVEGCNGLNFQEVTKRNSYTKNMLQKQKLNQEETHQNSFDVCQHEQLE